MDKHSTLASFFGYITDGYGSRNAIYWKDGGKYESINGNKLKELVYYAALALKEFGLKRNDKAAIISETRIEWVITDFACILNGIVTVPIYTTMTSQQIKFILEHSEAKLCFTSSKHLSDKVSAVFNELPGLQKIIAFNKIENGQEHILNFEDIIYNELLHDKIAYSEKAADKLINSAVLASKPDDILTIIYTSGTTGNSKGVCLTHKNVLTNVKQCVDSFKVSSEDRFLSFLPLAHTYERTAGYYLPLSEFAEIYYAQSLDTLMTQMGETKPTLVLTVPILFSKMQSRIIRNIESQTGIKKAVAKKALAYGMKYRHKKNKFLWKWSDKKVFSSIRERTGGKLRFFISGGSALNKALAEFFDSIGILILQGYGMTEASPVISVNREFHNKFGTVGPGLEGLTVKLAEDGEILVKGDNIMAGYYNNTKDTNETLIDGWLHTGDIGVTDNEGYITITDRKKTLIKTSGGKYISLTHVEDTIARSKYIDQIICFASDQRQYVTALVVPDFEELSLYAINKKIEYRGNISLIENKEIYSFMDEEIEKHQKDLAKYERVRKFSLMPKQFTIESGEMTPTLKLKRKVIEEKYKSLIDSFYMGR